MRTTTRCLWAPVVLAGLVLAGCSGGGDTWFIPKSPALRVNVAAGCPATDQGLADVVNTFRGPPLVPADPSGAMVCSYGARAGSGVPGSTTLRRAAILSRDEAAPLATMIRRLDLHKAGGEFNCPSDVGYAVIIGFAYAGRPDVGLWYADSGCQTLDNGRIGAFQGANPSFYNDFQAVIAPYVAPPE